jgi:hypothetical protein
MPKESFSPSTLRNPTLDGATTVGNADVPFAEQEKAEIPERNWRFWLSFLSLCIAVFIAAFELVRHYQFSPFPVCCGLEILTYLIRLGYPLLYRPSLMTFLDLSLSGQVLHMHWRLPHVCRSMVASLR